MREDYELFYLEYKGLHFALMYISEGIVSLKYRLDNILGEDNYVVHTFPYNTPEPVDCKLPFKRSNSIYHIKKIVEIHESLTLLQSGYMPNKKQFEDYCNELSSNHIICIEVYTAVTHAKIYLPYNYTISDLLSVQHILTRDTTFSKTLYTTYLKEVLGNTLSTDTLSTLSSKDERLIVSVIPKQLSYAGTL